MTDILLTTPGVAVRLFLVSSMSGMGLGLTLRQVSAPLDPLGGFGWEMDCRG